MRATLASTLVWVAWAAVLVLVAAAIAAILFVALTTATRSPCTSVDAEAITPEEARTLRTEGWYPDATKTNEALYSPGCLTPGSWVERIVEEAGDGERK